MSLHGREFWRAEMDTALVNEEIRQAQQRAAVKIWDVASDIVSAPDLPRLDAVQGSQDERVSRTGGTVSEGETPADAVMRQESWQSSELSSEAGQDGEEVWHG